MFRPAPEPLRIGGHSAEELSVVLASDEPLRTREARGHRLADCTEEVAKATADHESVKQYQNLITELERVGAARTANATRLKELGVARERAVVDTRPGLAERVTELEREIAAAKTEAGAIDEQIRALEGHLARARTAIETAIRGAARSALQAKRAEIAEKCAAASQAVLSAVLALEKQLGEVMDLRIADVAVHAKDVDTVARVALNRLLGPWGPPKVTKAVA